ncbi:MAG: hypothetical protein EHM15_03770 [Desulfobacteraceae bacterium]|nr:MAG: hypothetical protein EHM15_03770 [Desulfobacteraceae bacterium]
MMVFEPVSLVLLTLVYLAGRICWDRRHARRRYVSDDDALSGLAMARQCSAYDVFIQAGRQWGFSASKTTGDFNRYLRSGFIPRYVAGFARANIRPEEVQAYAQLTKGW